VSRFSFLLLLFCLFFSAAFQILGQDFQYLSTRIDWKSCPRCAIAQSTPVTKQIPRFKVKIIRTFPHDPDAFTEGMIYSGGFLYESTGLNGKSSMRKVELETGKVVKEFDLPSQYFGEGLTEWDDTFIQLTWRSGKGFVYNRETFSIEREFSFSGEGWGITHDGKSLIMSNGSDKLVYLNPRTFEQERVLPVLSGDKPVRLLNELEYIRDEIYANIWQKDFVARISPKTGEITGWIDMSDLRKELSDGQRADVLNGIAYDPEGDRIFVTGKLWSKLFQIEIVSQAEAGNQKPGDESGL
jgi:glutaminyl-peptide cyclotransferase